MKGLRWAATALVIVLAVGCRQSAGGVSNNPPAAEVQISVEPIPNTPSVGEAFLRITVTTPDGRPVTGAQIVVRGDMNHAGMQPVFGDAPVGGANGVYDVPFEWTMAGDWILTMTITLEDGSVATERIELNVRA